MCPWKLFTKIKCRKQMKNIYRQHSDQYEEQWAEPAKKNIWNNSRTRIFGKIKKYFGEWNAQNGPRPSLEKISPKKLKKTQLSPWKQFTKIKSRKQMKNIYRQHSAQYEEQWAEPAKKNIYNNSRTRIFGKIKKYFGEWNAQNGRRPFLQIDTVFGSSENWKVPVVWAFHAKKWRNIPKNFRDFDQKCQFLLVSLCPVYFPKISGTRIFERI